MNRDTYKVTLPITFTFPEPVIEQLVGDRKKVSVSKKRRTLAEMEKSCILEALDDANGVPSQAAKFLGIDLRTFKSKLKKYGIRSEKNSKNKRKRKYKSSKHTLESCVASAQKFKSRSEWQLNDRNSYSAARRNKWLDICCKHMTPKVKGRPARKQKQPEMVQ